MHHLLQLTLCLILPLAIANPHPSPVRPDAQHVHYRRDIPTLPPIAVGANDPVPSHNAMMQPSIPGAPQTVDGGVLVCQSEKVVSSSPEFYMAQDEAESAITSFCGRIPSGVVFKDVDGTPVQSTYNQGFYGYQMALIAQWMPNGQTNCPTLDFSNSTSYSVCSNSLSNIILNECNPGPSDFQFSKAGGNYTKDCMKWTIKRIYSI